MLDRIRFSFNQSPLPGSSTNWRQTWFLHANTALRKCWIRVSLNLLSTARNQSVLATKGMRPSSSGLAIGAALPPPSPFPHLNILQLHTLSRARRTPETCIPISSPPVFIPFPAVIRNCCTHHESCNSSHHASCYCSHGDPILSCS